MPLSFHNKGHHYLFLLLSVWLIVIPLLFYEFFFNFFLKEKTEKAISQLLDDSKYLPVIVDNKQKEVEKKDEVNQLYMSHQFQKARGQLTKEKKFSHLSNQEELEIQQQAGFTNKASKSTDKQLDILSTDNETPYIVHVLKNHKKKRNIITPRSYLKIPSSYEFKYKNAFSWDTKGNPLLPTFHYQHFDYIKKMLQKIRSNWYPPGGSPLPIDYRPSYVGSFTYRTIPPQKVFVVFMLDKQGEVLDVEIRASLGYERLNESIIEAIQKSTNFGTPPQDFIQYNRAFFPFIFKIY